jgi:UDP-glucose 4-epimerase
MRTLVTGGAGFIGSNLVDALMARGDDVTVVDDLSSGRESNLAGALAAGAQLERVDIRDAAALQGVAERVRPELIFHLAAQVDVRISIADPAYDARTNVEGTINVLEAARTADPERAARVVFSSTGGAIYGETDHLPTPESVEPLPMAAYGQSKFCAERYLGLFSRLFGDGRQTRDYIYVADLVDALLAAGASDADGVVNIGTEEETSVLAIVERLAELHGPDAPEPEFADARLGEIARSCLDAGRARELLGWEARTPIREGLRLTYESVGA